MTWGVANTGYGNLIAHICNITGMIEKGGVSEMDGLTAIGGITSGEMAFTIGPYSFGPKNYKATWKDHLFVHEYGHYLQHHDWGPLYLPIIGLPSLLSAMNVEDKNGKDHLTRWFEVDASKRGGEYFDRKYGHSSQAYRDAYNKDPYKIDESQFFNLKRFHESVNSPYINPRTGSNNQNRSYPSSFSYDFFDFTIPASEFLLLMIFL